MLQRLDVALAETRRLEQARDTGDWPQKVQRLIDECHPKQRAFVEDPHNRIAALVGGRGGKTTGVRARLVRRLMLTPEARCLFVATTLKQARKFMWRPLKKVISGLGLRIGVDAKFREDRLELELLKNGSVLTLGSADNLKVIEDYRGQPFHEVWIDECKSHKAALLRELMYDVLEPRLNDFGPGVLGMIGTPGHIFSGPFYEVTRPGSEKSSRFDERDERPADWDGWSLHDWSLRDGADAGVPAMVNAWAAALQKKRRDGWSDDHPTWKREYLGQWAKNDTESVFKYRPQILDLEEAERLGVEVGADWNQWNPSKLKNGFARLPHDGDWRFVIGMDMGHSDPFACQVFAYERHVKKLWHVFEFEKVIHGVRPIAELLIGESLNARKPDGVIGHTGWPDDLVADMTHHGKNLLAELRNVYGVHVEPADQKDKHDAIELFNGDLLDGRVVIMKNSKLEKQLLELQWDVDDYGRLREDRNSPNHSTDAAVYARRKAMHHFTEEAPATRPAPGTPEALNLEQEEAEERAAGAYEGDEEELMAPVEYDEADFWG